MKAFPRHYLLRLFGILGLLVALYITVQPLLFAQDPLCSKPDSIFACGATEDILKIPGFKYFNAISGFVFFCLITWVGFRLPRIGVERTRLRRGALLLANAGLGYAIFLRALELFITSKICPWCMMLFLSTAGATVSLWVEWAAARRGRDHAFLPGYFYSNMIKLTVVFVIASFGALCAVRDHLPQPDRDSFTLIRSAGFSYNLQEVQSKCAEYNFPYLVFFYKRGCIFCYRMSAAFQFDAVKQLIGNLPRAAVDFEEPETVQLAKQHGFKGVPVLALFSPQQELLFAISGFPGRREFERELREQLEQHRDALAPIIEAQQAVADESGV